MTPSTWELFSDRTGQSFGYLHWTGGSSLTGEEVAPALVERISGWFRSATRGIEVDYALVDLFLGQLLYVHTKEVLGRPVAASMGPREKLYRVEVDAAGHPQIVAGSAAVGPSKIPDPPGPDAVLAATESGDLRWARMAAGEGFKTGNETGGRGLTLSRKDSTYLLTSTRGTTVLTTLTQKDGWFSACALGKLWFKLSTLPPAAAPLELVETFAEFATHAAGRWPLARREESQFIAERAGCEPGRTQIVVVNALRREGEEAFEARSCVAPQGALDEAAARRVEGGLREGSLQCEEGAWWLVVRLPLRATMAAAALRVIDACAVAADRLEVEHNGGKDQW